MRRISAVLGVGLVLALGFGAAPAGAQSVYTLHIEPRPLDSALQELVRQTGMQILFYSRLTDGRSSAALDGKYTLDAAIATLLRDSNLTYRRVNPKTIEIVRERTRP